MSAPSFIAAFKNDVEIGKVHHNWGWVSPSDYEAGCKVIRIVAGIENSYGCPKLPNDWDYIVDRYFGKMTKESYYDFYDMLKSIHYGLIPKDQFKMSDYFKAL